ITNLLRGSAPLMILSAGMTLVIISKGIDLSVGSILGFAAIMIGITMPYGAGVAIVVALAAGSGLGVINGMVITKLKVEPFITTLAMLIAARGVVYMVSNGANIVMHNAPPWFAFIGSGYLFN